MLFGPQGTSEAMRMPKGPWSTLAFLPEPGEAWLSCASRGLDQATPSPAGSSPCTPQSGPVLRVLVTGALLTTGVPPPSRDPGQPPGSVRPASTQHCHWTLQTGHTGHLGQVQEPATDSELSRAAARKEVCLPSPLSFAPVLLLVLPELPCWAGHPLPPRPQPSRPLGAR